MRENILRRTGCFSILLILVCIILSSSKGFAQKTAKGPVGPRKEYIKPTAAQPRGKIEKVIVYYHKSLEDGREGVKIGIKGEVSGFHGERGHIHIHFKDESGRDILDKTQTFLVGPPRIYFNLRNGRASYSEQVFVPYCDLDLVGDDLKTVTVVVEVRESQKPSDWIVVATDSSQEFSFIPSACIPWGKIQRVWVDNDVYKNNKKGMMIHMHLIVSAIGQVILPIVYFYDRYGNPMRTSSSGFKNSTGYTCAYERVNPPYEITEWKDFKLFMPYDVLTDNKGHIYVKITDETTNKMIGWDISQDFSFTK